MVWIVGRALDLGQDDAVEPGVHDGVEIAVAELGVGGVDPDIEEPGARFSVSGHDRLAGRRLLGDGDGVLEVKDHRVGVEGQRLLDPARMIAGGKEERAEGHEDSFF